jgi:hypothetical protein
MTTTPLNANINSHLALLRERLPKFEITEEGLPKLSKADVLQALVSQGPEDSHIADVLSEALTQLSRFTPGELAEGIRRLDEPSANSFIALQGIKAEERETNEIIQPNITEPERYASPELAIYGDAANNTNTSGIPDPYDPKLNFETPIEPQKEVEDDRPFYIGSTKLKLNAKNIMNKIILSEILGPEHGLHSKQYIELFSTFTNEERAEIAKNLSERKTLYSLQSRLVAFTVNKITDLTPDQSQTLRDTIWDSNPDNLDLIKNLSRLHENKAMSYEDIMATAKGETPTSILNTIFTLENPATDLPPKDLLDSAFITGSPVTEPEKPTEELTTQTKQRWYKRAGNYISNRLGLRKKSAEIPDIATHETIDTIFSHGNPAVTAEQKKPWHARAWNSATSFFKRFWHDEKTSSKSTTVNSNFSSQHSSPTNSNEEPSPVFSMVIGGIAGLGGLLWGKFSGFSWKNILTSLFGFLVIGGGVAESFSNKK